MNSEIVQLVSNISELESKKSKNENQLEIRNVEIRSLSHGLTKLQQQFQMLEGAKSILEKYLNSSIAENTNLNSEVSQVKQGLTESQQIGRALETQLNNAQADLIAAKVQINQRRQQVIALQKLQTGLESTLKKEHSENTERKQTISQLKDKLINLQNSNTQLDKRVKLKEAETKYLNGQLSQFQSRFHETKKLRAGYQKQVIADHVETKVLQDEINELRLQVNTLQQVKIKLDKELEDADVENKTLISDTINLKKEINGLQQIKISLESQLETSTEEHCLAKEKVTILKKQITDLKITNMEIEMELECMKTEVKTKSDEIMNLKNICFDLDSMKVSLEHQLKAQQACNKALKNENEHYMHKQDIAEKNLADLLKCRKTEQDNNEANKLEQVELNIRLNKAEQRCTILEDSLKKEQTEKKTLKDELSLIQPKVIHSEENFAGLCVEIKGLSSEIAMVKDINVDLSNKVADLTNCIKKEQDFSEKLKKELIEAKQQASDLNTLQVGLAIQLEKQQTTSNYNNDRAKQEILELKQHIKGLEVVKTALENDATSGQSTNTSLKVSMDQLEQEVSSLKLANGKLENYLVSKDNALNAQLNETNKFKKLLNGEQAIRIGIENQLKNEQTEHKIRKTEQVQLLQQMEEMKKLNEDLAVKLKMEKSEKIACEEVANQQTNLLIWSGDQLKISQNTIEALKAEMYQLKTSYGEIQDKQTNLEKELKTNTKQLKKEQGTHLSKSCEITALRTQQDEIRSARDALEIQLRDEQKSKHILVEELYWLKEEASTLHIQQTDYENKLNEKKEAIHNLNEVLVETKNIHTGLEIKLNNLLNDNIALKEEVYSLKADLQTIILFKEEKTAQITNINSL